MNYAITICNLFDNTQAIKKHQVVSGHCNSKLQLKPNYKLSYKTPIFSYCF